MNRNLQYQSFDYKPFGDTLNAGGESRIGYAAQERDEESRYFAMGARQYDPLSGRFLSVDPLYEQFPDKTPYHYCNNNPISFKDPSGLSPEEEKKSADEVQTSMENPYVESQKLETATAREWTNQRALFMFLEWDNHVSMMLGDDAFTDGGGGGGSNGLIVKGTGSAIRKFKQEVSDGTGPHSDIRRGKPLPCPWLRFF